jgi:hypothetical protein
MSEWMISGTLMNTSMPSSLARLSSFVIRRGVLAGASRSGGERLEGTQERLMMTGLTSSHSAESCFQMSGCKTNIRNR